MIGCFLISCLSQGIAQLTCKRLPSCSWFILSFISISKSPSGHKSDLSERMRWGVRWWRLQKSGSFPKATVLGFTDSCWWVPSWPNLSFCFCLFVLDFTLFYVSGCFVCMYTCAPHVCLMPEEARRGCWELQVVVSCLVGTGNQTQVLWKCNNLAISPVPHSNFARQTMYLTF